MRQGCVGVAEDRFETGTIAVLRARQHEAFRQKLLSGVFAPGFGLVLIHPSWMKGLQVKITAQKLDPIRVKSFREDRLPMQSFGKNPLNPVVSQLTQAKPEFQNFGRSRSLNSVFSAVIGQQGWQNGVLTTPEHGHLKLQENLRAEVGGGKQTPRFS